MIITDNAFKSILNSFPVTLPEQGGILGEKEGTIIAYYHDTAAKAISTQAAYEPDIVSLNSQIREWAKDGISFCGLIHSHPEGETSLSDADMQYINKIFAAHKIGTKLYFPLVLNGGLIIPYAITKHEEGLSVIQEEIRVSV